MITFSGVTRTELKDGWLELRYDAIRVVIPPAASLVTPATGSPLGGPSSGSRRVQRTGVASFTCTDPRCINGVPPLVGEPAEQDALHLQGTGIASLTCTDPRCINGVPPLVGEPAEQAAFWMELPAAASVGTSEGGVPCLMVPGSVAPIAIPVFDAALGTGDALCDAATAYRESVDPLDCVAFHVYLIEVADGPLAALQGKRIALPLPSGCVAATAVAMVDELGAGDGFAIDDEVDDADAVVAEAGEPMRSSA